MQKRETINILHECERVRVLWISRAAQNSLGVSLGCDPYAQAGAAEPGGKSRKSTCSKHVGQTAGRVAKEKREWKKRVLSWQRGQTSQRASKEELPANWIFHKPCYIWGTPRSEPINEPLHSTIWHQPSFPGSLFPPKTHFTNTHLHFCASPLRVYNSC